MILDDVVFLGCKKVHSTKKNEDFYFLSFYAHKNDFNGKDYEYEGSTCMLDTEDEYDLVKKLQPFDTFRGTLYRNGNNLAVRVVEVGD